MDKPFDKDDRDKGTSDALVSEEEDEQKVVLDIDDDEIDEMDPVRAALAMAASIAPTTGEYRDDDSVEEAISLKQVIDRADRRIDPDSGFLDDHGIGIPEELDAMDIRAELGRPDVEMETSKLLRATQESLESDIPPPPPQTVEEAPRVSTEPSGLRLGVDVKWHGSLASDRLWTLLGSAYLEKRSGAIVVEHGDVERKIFIDKGEIIVATSTAREDRLVDLLYREGRLSDEEYRGAAKTVGLSGRRVGAILVERGLISSRELFPLVRHHYETIIHDTFAWPEGLWRYDPDAVAQERILLTSPSPALILEGIRADARPEDIMNLAPSNFMPVGLQRGICKIEEAGLVPEELDVYFACDGTATVDKLATRYDIEKVELRKMLAGLTALGLLGQAASVESSDAPGQPGQPDLISGAAITRSRVTDKLAQIDEGSYFNILEINASASGYEIRKAYRRLKAEFAPERFAVGALIDIQPQSEKIQLILDESYEILRDPARREAYRQGIRGYE